MGHTWDTLDRIRRVRVKRDNGMVRAEVTLVGMDGLSPNVVLEAAEQLRQVLEYLQITDLSMVPADADGRTEN
ncbi:MAG TPA: hypothetical protein VNA31_08930 [bacterium]|nr:hypothetical protein [bacterium]